MHPPSRRPLQPLPHVPASQARRPSSSLPAAPPPRPPSPAPQCHARRAQQLPCREAAAAAEAEAAAAAAAAAAASLHVGSVHALPRASPPLGPENSTVRRRPARRSLRRRWLRGAGGAPRRQRVITSGRGLHASATRLRACLPAGKATHSRPTAASPTAAPPLPPPPPRPPRRPLRRRLPRSRRAGRRAGRRVGRPPTHRGRIALTSPPAPSWAARPSRPIPSASSSAVVEGRRQASPRALRPRGSI